MRYIGHRQGADQHQAFIGSDTLIMHHAYSQPSLAS